MGSSAVLTWESPVILKLLSYHGLKLFCLTLKAPGAAESAPPSKLFAVSQPFVIFLR